MSISWLSYCWALSSTIVIYYIFKAVAAFIKTRAHRLVCLPKARSNSLWTQVCLSECFTIVGGRASAPSQEAQKATGLADHQGEHLHAPKTEGAA